MFLWILVVNFTLPPLVFGQNSSENQSEFELKPQPESWNKIKQDPDLQYPTDEIGKGDGFWDFLTVISEFLERVFGKDSILSDRDFILNTLYVISILLIIFAIYKISPHKFKGLFSKANRKVSLAYDIHEENIHEINFEEELEKAIASSAYRLAIRLKYLHVLKILSDQHLIEWEESKTDYQYLQELKKTTVYNHFEQLSYHFTYVWYGHFEVNEVSYKNVDIPYQAILNHNKSTVL